MNWIYDLRLMSIYCSETGARFYLQPHSSNKYGEDNGKWEIYHVSLIKYPGKTAHKGEIPVNILKNIDAAVDYFDRLADRLSAIDLNTLNMERRPF